MVDWLADDLFYVWHTAMMMSICMYLSICRCLSICMYLSVSTYLYVPVYVSICVCLSVRAYVSISMCLSVSSVNVLLSPCLSVSVRLSFDQSACPSGCLPTSVPASQPGRRVWQMGSTTTPPRLVCQRRCETIGRPNQIDASGAGETLNPLSSCHPRASFQNNHICQRGAKRLFSVTLITHTSGGFSPGQTACWV